MELEKIILGDTIIASSTSSFLPSELQKGCTQPERVIVGHPMNPPHLVPAVEIVLGQAFNPEIANRAMLFYRSLKEFQFK